MANVEMYGWSFVEGYIEPLSEVPLESRGDEGSGWHTFRLTPEDYARLEDRTVRWSLVNFEALTPTPISFNNGNLSVRYNDQTYEHYRVDAMEEAKRVLDKFPVGHAEYIRDRMVTGMISGSSYGMSKEYFNHLNGMGLRSIEECPACFYGTLAYVECGNADMEWIRSQIAAVSNGASVLERYFAKIRRGDTPENSPASAEFVAFLNDYIQQRHLAAEASCALTETVDEDMYKVAELELVEA